MYQSIPKPPLLLVTPGTPVGIWCFSKNFDQIPWYVGILDGQMPHWLVLQKASNSPPTSDY